MISLPLARQLKQAGLVWQAAMNDYFAIPDRGMDERVFVLAHMQAQLDLYRGWPVVTFHGTAEWALDYILTAEVIWLPREEQVRNVLLELLPAEGATGPVSLLVQNGHYVCTIPWRGSAKQFDGSHGADAYGAALLFVLKNQSLQST
ncbi:MAG: pilus assembly protein CpaE [Candidatus Promineifilaceae bacterium]